MPDKPRPTLNLRLLQRREDRRLAMVIAIFVVTVGGAAIGLVYGWSTAAWGGICLLAGAGMFGLLWLILSLIERWVGRE
jgi:hypothetical protein